MHLTEKHQHIYRRYNLDCVGPLYWLSAVVWTRKSTVIGAYVSRDQPRRRQRFSRLHRIKTVDKEEANVNVRCMHEVCMLSPAGCIEHVN